MKRRCWELGCRVLGVCVSRCWKEVRFCRCSEDSVGYRGDPVTCVEVLRSDVDFGVRCWRQRWHKGCDLNPLCSHHFVTHLQLICFQASSSASHTAPHHSKSAQFYKCWPEGNDFRIRHVGSSKILRRFFLDSREDSSVNS